MFWPEKDTSACQCLAVEFRPSDETWFDLCQQLGVRLCWPPDFNGLWIEPDGRAPQSPSAAPATAGLTTPRTVRSARMVSPEPAASNGLTSRRASKVMARGTGITRSVASSAEGSLSAGP